MVPGFDSHAHLHFSHFDEDLDAVVRKAAAAGITDVMIPSVDVETSRKSAEIASAAGYKSAAAFHPEHLPSHEEAWQELKSVVLKASVAAVGETGLDLHHRTFPFSKQLEWFHRHISFAQSISYPLIVHSRKAEAQVLSELPENPGIPVILHCWNGDAELTEKAVARGFYIGAAGPVTYRKNRNLRNVIASVPPELLLAETDAPFLPPEPYRGRRNEPAYTAMVIRKIRELMKGNHSIEETSFILWENAMRAFKLHPLNRRADIVYTYCGSVYINLTSKCQNNCSFCISRYQDGLDGYYLRHREDPSEELVLSTIEAFPLESFGEAVFCGFGEPTLRPELLRKCAAVISARGLQTRLNTNGLCIGFLGRDKAVELMNSFDAVSISLNASGEKEYERICSPEDKSAWNNLLEFIRLAKAELPSVAVSAVSGSGADIHRVQKLADRLNLNLKVRGG
ncbi:hypothetical protein CSA37_04405 [Candidatus Fermentibacteria bacterium]|nr:MAG: hypothetical protein CSA37_04405 [Candidatus Fermentibacteria bacterium]